MASPVRERKRSRSRDHSNRRNEESQRPRLEDERSHPDEDLRLRETGRTRPGDSQAPRASSRLSNAVVQAEGAKGGAASVTQTEPEAPTSLPTSAAASTSAAKGSDEPSISRRRLSPQPLEGSVARTRNEPLSLEVLLKNKKAQQEEEAKPKFLSKAQRQALASAKRSEEVAAQRAQVDAVRSAGRSAHTSGSMLFPPPRSGGGGGGDDRRDARGGGRTEERGGRDDRGGRRDDDRGGRDDRRGGDDRRDDRREPERRADRPPAGQDGQRRQETREKERELELIKQQYLGQEKNKKKVLKPSEKFKFNFDWDAGDDTSKDLNPLYNATHQAAILYGRGMLAGIDRREQKKAAAQTEKEMMRRARQAAGISESSETRAQERERERLADTYGEMGDMKVDKHWTEKAVEDMTERDWRIFREDFNIAYKGTNTVLPIRNWDEAGLPAPLRKAVDKAGYKKPSPIQMAAIPLGLQQRDVIGIAETGSGKTAAFVLPMLTYIMRQPVMTEATEADGPYSVVMAPTRELAQQIEDETVKLCEYTTYRVTSIVGGQSIEEQGAKLRRGCEIVIATPGRLIDCLERHYAVLNQCNYVVLDEADRMIDLGFEPQVMGVLDAMPSSNLKPEGDDSVLEADRVYRTTYMFSATMPPAVERLARKYLRRPCVVTIGTAGRATDNVAQKVYMLKENEKPTRLRQELDQVDEKRAIVFVNTKRQCDNVYAQLDQLGHRCTVLHSGRSQDQRSDSIKGFRTDVYNILIATDVAGRGIDVPDVALVINYDMANTTEAYTHRIGRTGRAGKKGIAATFLTMGDTEVFFDLKRLLEECKAAVPPELARHEAAKNKPGAIGTVRRRDQTVFAKT